MKTLTAMARDQGLDEIRGLGRILWVGAASFEERCVHSLRCLRESGIQIEKAIVLLYETKVEPQMSGEQARHENLSYMLDLANSFSRRKVVQKALPAYAYGAARRLVAQQLSATDYDIVIFDVSCLTKIHSVALATAIAAQDSVKEAVVAYVAAENYPGIAETEPHPLGWLDIIVAPLSTSARFFNESNSRGIIILGHEVDRLIVALSEIEPSGGAIVSASTRTRPDIGEVSVRKNSRVVRQLTKMRAVDWNKSTVDLTDVRTMESIVVREAEKAGKHSAPVILFPYGPKPLLFVSALTLARTYYDGSWFVYPIPASYDVTYSEGVGDLMWLRMK